MTRGRKLPKVIPDCMTCGLCCISTEDQEAYADVTEEDVERLGAKWSAKNVLRPSTFDQFLSAVAGPGLPPGAIRTTWKTVRSGPLAKWEVCACVALKGDPMRSVKCAVYERRPQTCRVAVKPGDRTCMALRRMFEEHVASSDEGK